MLLPSTTMSANNITLNTSALALKSATIFQSSTAELTRLFTVDLKSGNNIIEITGISDGVDPDSPRITAAGANVRVRDVVCLWRKPFDMPRSMFLDGSSEASRAVAAECRALQAERGILQQEASLLDESAKLVTSSGKDESGSGQMYLLDFLSRFAERKLSITKDIQILDEKIAEAEKKTWLLNSKRKGEAAVAVKVTVLANSDCQAELKLTYLVSGITWQPFYDLHATTASDGRPSSDVSLRYCATITQSTGEDWDNTMLTLSTATSQALKHLSVPPVHPLKVSVVGDGAQATSGGGLFGNSSGPPPGSQPHVGGLFGRAPPAPGPGGFGLNMARTVSQAATAQTSSGGLFGSSSAPIVAQQAPQAPQAEPAAFATASALQERERDREREGESVSAVPNRSSLSVAYRVEGAVSLPSDGQVHKLTIATLDFKAGLSYHCAPRQSRSVYIVSKVKNTSDYELLAGTVNVFMNDSFVTKTDLGFISANESFACVLGIDPSLKVSYEQNAKTEHEPRRNFAEPHKTTTLTDTTTVTNTHAFAVYPLIVRGAVPLGNEQVQIAVNLRKPSGLAEAKDGQEVEVDVGLPERAKVRWTRVVDGKGGEKDGLYEWVCSIPAGGKVTLEAQRDVKAPSNLQWHEVPQMVKFC
ncbi:hypothetical protein BD413DRAFT_720002 [Trametes elegans]|nr:hypothetical protein BD413DRAFT_720002 [Trametes elegans]